MLTHTTTNNYIIDRFSFLRLVEAYRQYAYADAKGIATIGIGVNLQTHQNLILRTFGFDLDRSLRAQGASQADAAEQGYIAQVRAVLNTDYTKKGTVGSTGRRNTCLQSIRRRAKAQGLAGSLIQA